jgi:cytosine/uracil/thiamine/allantoin permease
MTLSVLNFRPFGFGLSHFSLINQVVFVLAWLGIQTTVGSGCDYLVRFCSYPFLGHFMTIISDVKA